MASWISANRAVGDQFSLWVSACGEISKDVSTGALAPAQAVSDLLAGLHELRSWSIRNGFGQLALPGISLMEGSLLTYLNEDFQLA